MNRNDSHGRDPSQSAKTSSGASEEKPRDPLALDDLPADDEEVSDAEAAEARADRAAGEDAFRDVDRSDDAEDAYDEIAGASEVEEGRGSKEQEYFDQLLRLKAEFDNYRRRISRERQDWARAARAGVLTELLTVLDDAKRARHHAEETQEVDVPGIMLIFKRFEETLAQLGLEELVSEPGTEFDPEVHEALMATPSADIDEGQIVSVLQPGYTYEGQLLRPGKVSVSSGHPNGG